MRKFDRKKPVSISIDSNNNVKSYSTVKQKLREELLFQTQYHCSFCDLLFDYKILAGFKPEIEHFKPQNLFPYLAKNWGNMFISCRLCNEAKGSKYEDIYDQYKPDLDEYLFENHFEINSETFDIKPRYDGKSETEISNAGKFIDWFGLNETERRTARLRVFKEIKNRANEEFYLDDLSYRFVFEYFNTFIKNYCPNIQ